MNANKRDKVFSSFVFIRRRVHRLETDMLQVKEALLITA
jgi:hypothetical protein